MNQDLDNKINLKYKILSFIRENKIKISFLATAILIAFFIFIYQVENNKKRKYCTFWKIYQAGLNFSNKKLSKLKKIMKKLF